MKSFIAALGFLTRIPMPNTEINSKQWKKSVLHYPFVGVIIGSILVLSSYTFTIFSSFLASILILTVWVWITGGLHLDGWMDLADGIGSNRSKERMLEIMKDSRVGAMGVIAALLLFLLKVGAIHELFILHSTLFLLIPTLLARFILLIAIHYFPYVSNEGLGTGLKEFVTTRKIMIWFSVILTFVYLLFSIKGMMVIIASLLIGFLFLHYISRKLGGLNGDCYGATIEWTELVTLLTFIVIERMLG